MGIILCCCTKKKSPENQNPSEKNQNPSEKNQNSSEKNQNEISEKNQNEISEKNLTGQNYEPDSLGSEPEIIMSVEYKNFLPYNQECNFNNDEDLIKQKPADTNLLKSLISISMKSYYKNLKLSSYSNKQVPCTVSIAIDKPKVNFKKLRSGIDLILVVDVSSSMGGNKLNQIKSTLECVAESLKKFDRCCIIAFSNNAYVCCPLVVMNREGKNRVKKIISYIEAHGSTNIETGVAAALHVLADRKQQNQQASMLILSGSEDDKKSSISRRIQDLQNKYKGKIKGGFSINTFGYKDNHDSKIMSKLAEDNNGDYYYIKNQRKIADTFGMCIGDLFSTVINNISITLKLNPSKNVELKLGKMFNKTNGLDFFIKNANIEGNKDAVFVLEFPAQEVDLYSISPVTAEVKYELINREVCNENVSLNFKIAKKNKIEEIDDYVLHEYYRVRVSEAIKNVVNCVDDNKFEDARRLLTIFKEDIKKEMPEAKNREYIKLLDKHINTTLKAVSQGNSGGQGVRAQISSLAGNLENQKPINNMHQNSIQQQLSSNIKNNVKLNKSPKNSVSSDSNFDSSSENSKININPSIPNKIPIKDPTNIPKSNPKIPIKDPNKIPIKDPTNIPKSNPKIPIKDPSNIPNNHPKDIPKNNPNNVPKDNPKSISLFENDRWFNLEGHESYVSSIAISFDNKYIVSGSWDKTVRIWSIPEKRQVAILEGHADIVSSVGITRDNKYAVTGSWDKTLKVWNLEKKLEEAVLEGHSNCVSSVAITHDCKYIISGGNDMTLRVWNFQEKNQEIVFQGHTDTVSSVAINKKNKFIVSGSSDNTVRVWNFEERRQEAVLQGHTNLVTSVVITQNSKYIVSGSWDWTVRIWNLEEMRQEAVFEGFDKKVMSLTITCDDRYAVFGLYDRTVRIWSLQEKRQEALLKGHNDFVSSVAISHDNKHIVSGSLNELKLWKIKKNN